MVIYLGISLFFENIKLNDVKIVENIYSIDYSVEIIKNNIKNFLQYFFFFFMSPILIIIDLSIIVFEVWIGINKLGGRDTLSMLLIHGIIEFPNMVLYMLLSFSCMKIFYKNFNLEEAFGFMRDNYRLYLLCIFNIIIAGLIEGMIQI